MSICGGGGHLFSLKTIHVYENGMLLTMHISTDILNFVVLSMSIT